MARADVNRSLTIARTTNVSRSQVPQRQSVPLHIPRWRGFNLTNYFGGNTGPYYESDFQMISQYGFNFVRLPLTYTQITVPGDPTTFSPTFLTDLDQAIAWGQQYGIHVCICFHSVPGYSVLTGVSNPSLWKDSGCQQTLINYWKVLATRYKGIPNSQISFNIINEPQGVKNWAYADLIAQVCYAIRQIDPTRLIISDGMLPGSTVIPEVIPLNIAQSYHSYTPQAVTGYRDSWIDTNNDFPLPQWPFVNIPNRLYGSFKSNYQKPLVICGNFKAGDTITLHVDVISNQAQIQFKADGNIILDTGVIVCTASGPGTPVYNSAWNIYQNIINSDYTAILLVDSQELDIFIPYGDWVSFTQVLIHTNGQTTTLTPTATSSDVTLPSKYDLDVNGNLIVNETIMYDKAKLQQKFSPWAQIYTQGVDVHVSETGCSGHTPHNVALAWMEDNLAVFKEAGIGWALWNFRGEYGVFDSGRTDVIYQPVTFPSGNVHQLDTAMMQLLQQY